MEQEILTKDQKKVLDLVKKDALIRDAFYLSGGTALAGFYLFHRYSDDLDFFTNANEFPNLQVEAFVKEAGRVIEAEKIDYKRVYDRRIFFLVKGKDLLKIEFTDYPFIQLETPTVQDGVKIDSLQDIAANKLMALFDRIEPKDFVDFYWILKEEKLSLPKIREDVEKKFSFTMDAVALGSEFAKVRMVTQLPNMIKPLTIDTLKAFYEEIAKELSSEVLQ